MWIMSITMALKFPDSIKGPKRIHLIQTVPDLYMSQSKYELIQIHIKAKNQSTLFPIYMRAFQI